MGSHTLEKKRRKMIDVLDERTSNMTSLKRRFDFLRDFVYAVVDYLDEESLDSLIAEFSK